MTPEVVIKEVNVRDHFDRISALMEGLHLSERSLFNKTASWKEIESSYMRHVIEMQDSYDGTFLSAFYNEQMVGFIFGYIEEPDDSRIEEYTGPELYVSDGYVVPEFRKLGIYRQLNAALEEKYIQQGVRRIIRFTLYNNDPMKNFLSGAGYSPTRILYEKWL